MGKWCYSPFAPHNGSRSNFSTYMSSKIQSPLKTRKIKILLTNLSSGDLNQSPSHRHPGGGGSKAFFGCSIFPWLSDQWGRVKLVFFQPPIKDSFSYCVCVCVCVCVSCMLCKLYHLHIALDFINAHTAINSKII